MTLNQIKYQDPANQVRYMSEMNHKEIAWNFVNDHKGKPIDGRLAGLLAETIKLATKSIELKTIYREKEKALQVMESFKHDLSPAGNMLVDDMINKYRRI